MPNLVWTWLKTHCNWIAYLLEKNCQVYWVNTCYKQLQNQYGLCFTIGYSLFQIIWVAIYKHIIRLHTSFLVFLCIILRYFLSTTAATVTVHVPLSSFVWRSFLLCHLGDNYFVGTHILALIRLIDMCEKFTVYVTWLSLCFAFFIDSCT